MYLLMSALAILGGVFFAIQGPVNTALGTKTSIFQASLFSFLGGTIFSGILVLILGDSGMNKIIEAKFWQLIGGTYGAVSVCVTVAAIPILGAALALTALMAGQLLAGIVIDYFGLLDSSKVIVTGMRFAGIAAATIGIFVIYFGSKKSDTEEKNRDSKRIIVVIAELLAGMLSAMQSPTNASLARIIGNWEGTFVSFIAGSIVLLPVALFADKGKFLKMRGVGIKPWMMTGGFYGVTGIFLSLLTITRLGAALQVACIMIGQLSCGLIIDTFGLLHTTRVKINLLRIAGIAMITVGVILVTCGK